MRRPRLIWTGSFRANIVRRTSLIACGAKLQPCFILFFSVFVILSSVYGGQAGSESNMFSHSAEAPQS